MNGSVCIQKRQLPQKLREIPDPPQKLWVKGTALSELCKPVCLAVIGSRKATPYGRAALAKILPEVVQSGVVIVSGLAIGIDAVAHQTTLEYGGKTIAVLPSSVNEVYPASNRQLAQQILQQGGALVSEYPAGTEALRHHFIARNRIVSGLSQAVLIIEAAEKSGTLHTANFALEQGRDVLVVPGDITRTNSAGTNNLLKAGASPVTSSEDILHALGIEGKKQQKQLFLDSDEQLIIDLINSGISETPALLEQSQLDPATFNQTLTKLELEGHIKPIAGHWTSRIC